MKAIRGRFDGRVVVLEEPAPVSHETAVTVEFPDPSPTGRQPVASSRTFHWERSRALRDSYAGSVGDELDRQRRVG